MTLMPNQPTRAQTMLHEDLRLESCRHVHGATVTRPVLLPTGAGGTSPAGGLAERGVTVAPVDWLEA